MDTEITDHREGAEGFLRMQAAMSRRLQEIAPSAVNSDAEFLLEHGRTWLPDPRYIRKMPVGLRRGRPHECFNNAFLAAQDYSSRYLYCEGRAMRCGHPTVFEHAWLVDRSTGLLIEPTLKDVRQYTFFGIALPIDVVTEFLDQTGTVFGYGLSNDRIRIIREHSWKGCHETLR